MRGDEIRVEDAFVRWLESDGWQVRRQVNHLDVLATRDGRELRAEVKGDTGPNSGLDADTMYGQPLRRMKQPDEASYAVVGPTRSVSAILRVKRHVRQLLGIRVFDVTADGRVVEHQG